MGLYVYLSSRHVRKAEVVVASNPALLCRESSMVPIHPYFNGIVSWDYLPFQ